MNPNEPKSFIDRSTILAILIGVAFWVGWSVWMDKKYPKPPVVAVSAKAPGTVAVSNQSVGTSTGGTIAIDGTTTNNVGGEAIAGVAEAQTPEMTIDYKSDVWTFTLSSRGMGIRDVNVGGYKKPDGAPIVLGDVQRNLSFASQLVGSSTPIEFQIQKESDQVFKGTAKVGEMVIEKTMRMLPATFVIETEIKVSNITPEFKGVSTFLSDRIHVSKNTSFLNPSHDHQDLYWASLDAEQARGTQRTVLNPEKGWSLDHKNVLTIALSQHYFSLVLHDHSPLLGNMTSQIAPNADAATVVLTHAGAPQATNLDVKYLAFAGPKSYSLLRSIDENLAHIVDYGMFGFLAQPLLWLLKQFYEMFGNWGIAIILMTILVRLVLLPLNVTSFRKMKRFQQKIAKLKPELAKLQAKKKEGNTDRMAQNQEMMELYKKHNVNPLEGAGGCLPVLPQLPIFFALSMVLSNSIEFYGANFGLWITDLSVKDPYYVLPLIMGVLMYLQQKLTPMPSMSDDDDQAKAQQKIMKIMPIFFTFLMFSLPAGLNLYAAVSMGVGILQQYWLTKSSPTEDGAAA